MNIKYYLHSKMRYGPRHNTLSVGR